MGQRIIRTATPADIEVIRGLITSEGMPPIEIEEWLGSFFVLEGDGRVLGCVGIERYGDAAVLRSITTDPSLRGTGEGVRLAQHALDYARQDGAKRCYLFTMTASEFFTKFGFEPCTLDDFEPAARESWQWLGVSEHEQLRDVLLPMRLIF